MCLASRQAAILLLILVSVSVPGRAQDLPGLLDGIGSSASSVIGGDALLDVELLDTPLDGAGIDAGTDLLLLGAPSDESPLQAENVDLLAEDTLASDLDAFNTEFEDGTTLKVNRAGDEVCPDSDRDTVCDRRDECPDTPRGQLVMPNGCGLGVQRVSPGPEFSSGYLPVAGVDGHLAELDSGFVQRIASL